LHLQLNAVLELLLLDFVAIGIDDIDLNRKGSTLSLPVSVIWENFKISVSSPMSSSYSSSPVNLI
jgi:hypothetical protein